MPLHRSLLALICVALAACGAGDAGGCVSGPCTTGGDGAVPVVAGFPSARAFSGVGRLAPDDSITLYAIRVGRTEEPCAGKDTLRSNVNWGVSNPAVATVTPLTDGGVRVRMLGQGTFQMLMREGGVGPPSPLFDTMIVYTCPAGLSIVSIAVAP
jgi:hypothetical protein